MCSRFNKPFMKEIKTILLALSLLVSFSACTDKDLDVPEVPEEPEVVEEGPDYLVMLYSVGGKSLDMPILSNIYQALDVGSSKNVKMTVQFKSSVREQKWYPEFDGTRRFDLDDNTHFVGTMKDSLENSPVITEPKELKSLFSQLKSECIADSLYDMTKSDALADFITWSMKQHPNAKRTVLILSDHGSGWQLRWDGMQDTRAILQDDNTKTIMSLGAVVEGINKSAGKVDLLYTDACLMSMYENLYGYAHCANYLLTAVETTPGAGGDYSKLLNNLKTAGTSSAGLENAMHDFADYLVSDQWWTNQRMISLGYGGDYHDIALYDLSKLDLLTPVIKKVVDTMVEKAGSNESVEPTVENPPFGEPFRGYINYALTSCQMSSVDDRYPVLSVPYMLYEYIVDDKVETHNDSSSNYFHTLDLVRWMKYANTENAQEARKNFPDIWTAFQRYLILYGVQSFSFTDILRLLDKSLTEAGAQNNPFKQLKAEMLAALKEVGYIRCTIGDEKPGIDQAYELCSPGITIVPFNDSYYDKISNTFLRLIPTHDEAMRMYQQTEFDKLVGWSRILQYVEIFPDVFSNPTRDHVDKDDEMIENLPIYEDKISYNLLSVEAAQEYFAYEHLLFQITPLFLDLVMQKRNSTFNEWYDLAMRSIQPPTPANQAFLDSIAELQNNTLEALGIELPLVKKIDVIDMKMDAFRGSAAFTAGNRIYFDFGHLRNSAQDESKTPDKLLWHEIWHVLSRKNPELRRQMYALIGFTILDKEIVIPEELEECILCNPDVERHDSYATFTINGKPTDCMVMLYADKDDPLLEFKNLTNYIGTAEGYWLLALDSQTHKPYRDENGKWAIYNCREVSDFDKVMSDGNTGYCDDPEECMADNFALAMTNDKKYPNQKLLQDIRALFQK